MLNQTSKARSGLLLFKSSKGAVTVFQILILVSLLVLIGILVDISRLFVAQRKVELSIASAARSVIACYNKDLVGDYGLFAVDTSLDNQDKRDTFIKFMKLNLNSGDSFKYINYSLDEALENTHVSGFSGLDKSEILKDQIVEYMKYKAPVTITESIVDKFRASGIFKKLEFSKKEKSVREKREILQEGISKTNNKLSEFKFGDDGINLQTLKQRLMMLNDVQALNESIVAPLEEYYNANEQSKNFVEELKEEDPLIEINTTTNSEFDNVKASTEKLNNEIKINREQINELIVIVEGLEAEKNELSLELEHLEAEYNEVSEKKDSLNSEIESYKLLKYELDELKVQIKTIESKTSLLKQSYSENVEEIVALENELSRLYDLVYIKEAELMEFEPLSDMEFSYDNAVNCCSNLNAEIEYRNIAIARIVTSISEKLSDFEIYGMDYIQVDEPVNDLDDRPADQGEGVILTQLIERLRNNEGRYLRFLTDDMLYKNINQESYETEQYEPEAYSNSDEEKAEEDNGGIMAFLDGIKQIFNAAVEKVFVVEFILDRFTYFTSDVERGHYFHKGEAEYILFGSRKQIDNIVKTWGSVWFLRFAVDSIDQFAVSKNPHPGYRLIYSLGKGFLNSCKDIFELYRGEFVNLSPSLKTVKINYSDHLRIFLLLQSITSEKNQMDNITQLIHANIKQSDADFDITKQSTVVYCCARVEVNLWFIPILHVDRLGLERFRNGCYIIDKEIYVGY